jgi:hypothetical protein
MFLSSAFFMLLPIVFGSFHVRVERAEVLNFVPFIKQHDIVVVDYRAFGSVLCIDFTPTEPRKFVKMILGENVPAEIRIRELPIWSLDKWHKSPSLRICDIHNRKVRKIMHKVAKEWPTEINLFTHNCKHFRQFLITELSN